MNENQEFQTWETQKKILGVLSHLGGRATPLAIGNTGEIPKPTLQKHIITLKQQGYIEPIKAEKRAREYQITKKGREFLEKKHTNVKSPVYITSEIITSPGHQQSTTELVTIAANNFSNDKETHTNSFTEDERKKIDKLAKDFLEIVKGYPSAKLQLGKVRLASQNNTR